MLPTKNSIWKCNALWIQTGFVMCVHLTIVSFFVSRMHCWGQRCTVVESLTSNHKIKGLILASCCIALGEKFNLKMYRTLESYGLVICVNLAIVSLLCLDCRFGNKNSFSSKNFIFFKTFLFICLFSLISISRYHWHDLNPWS